MNTVTFAPILGMIIASISILICFASKTSEVQKWLTGATVSVFLYFLGNYFFVISVNVNDFYQSHKVIYIGTMLLGMCFAYALAELCEVTLPKWFHYLMTGIILFCAAATLTLDMHPYWYASVTMKPLENHPGYYEFIPDYDWMFYAINALMMSMLLVYIVFLMIKILHKKGKKNSALKIILIVIATPPITLLLSELHILSTQVSNHAMIIGINIAIIILQIRHDIMTTVPVAKERAIESTTDGIIILNIHEEYLFANPTISKIFSDIDWDNSVMADQFIKENMLGHNKYLHENGNEYELRREEIIDGDKKRGFILWVVNVTEQTLRIREEEKTKKAMETLLQAITALATSIDAKDKYTNGHSLRVAKYSRMLAQRMGKPEEELDNIYNIAMLHDVGKIGIPDEIINKPTKLNDDEFNIIKSHSLKGYEILSKITSYPELAAGARWHHERYDGKGYVDHLAGDNIPEVARIIAIADCYDAMSSTRSYRNALPQDTIRQEIIKNSGIQFDPELAKLWIQIMDEDVNYELHE